MRLIDADELMELYENTPECNIDDCHVAIPVIRQNILDMPTVNPYEWISVEDKLPKVAVGVLITDGKNVSDGYVLNMGDSGLCPWVARQPVFHRDITHWMPIPTPPTEKES